ncbi:glycoside hydrolase family 3 N-terminal domain-containing protein [Capnocytophaga sp. ARDL2]|uniref:glycoside hydrolase family 3 N-terminal domain-containing protein n=1 Tax=Capnocytophaga sp. ARDL2 TaxID=3238809 RepID=UPI0035567D9E
MKKIVIALAILPLSMCAQPKKFSTTSEQWADSLYQTMTLREKIGQLFMVAAYSNKDQKHVNQIEKLISEQHIGGVIFFQGGPYRQAKITNTLQNKSKIPLLVGIDAEWGLAMRLDSTYRYPYNMSLGAIQNNELLYKMGQQMGHQAKRLGVHFMFAPVVDVNTNPKNPVIGGRSFGESKENVAEKSLKLIKGMQSTGVYATAKHFPGHGDTSTDSHHTLPILKFDKNRLHDIELYPYKRIIPEGLASIMVAHLEVPVLESEKGRPTSISYKTVTKLLKEDLNFDGLIFTDALNMKGASNYKTPGQIDLEAFLAGNDVLLFPENVPLAVDLFVKAIEQGKLKEERLAESVKKILKHKHQANLHRTKTVDLYNLTKDLNPSIADDLSFLLYKNMLTALKNNNLVIPLKATEKIAYIALGNATSKNFEKALKKFGNITVVDADDVREDLSEIEGFDRVIIGYHKEDNVWKNHSFSNKEKQIISDVAKQKSTVLVSFAKPYVLGELSSINHLDGLLLAYQNNDFTFEAVANALFGYSEINGKTPVSIGNHFPEHAGLWIDKSHSIEISRASLEGVDADRLNDIKRYTDKVLRDKIAPGGQILVIKDDKIIYDQVFGTLDYENRQEVSQKTVYDLASLSKILGTLPVVMKMYEEGALKLEAPISQYLSEFKETDKANITIKELLTHQSGLIAWIPFYKQTLDDNKRPDKELYSTVPTKNNSLKVFENLYLTNEYKKEMLQRILDSKMGAKKYVYSDLNFILLQQIVERHYQQPLDVLLQRYFLDPMELTTISYNPLSKMDINTIAPTEKDTYYRYATIQGYVHDMGAAMLGGVGGHAGLFGNAYEVGQMMQMFLNGGKFKDKQLLKTSTINTFNTCFYCQKGNRRGAGFDKPQLTASGPTCGCTSPDSFGHTGFTGTMAWADPQQKLIYVFLSNRTYPSANENKLSKANIREDIQQVIYDSL